MEYIIFDLEATCEDRNIDNNFKNEIIEIGAVKLNEYGLQTDTFSRFAKPYDGVALTEFCKQLTTIKQEHIDIADYLDEVLIDFYNWSNGCMLISWGGYDMRQITRDVVSQNIEHIIDLENMISRHFNLKRLYKEHKKLKRECGMGKALQIENINLVGTHHRGIDDAKNISKIFEKHFEYFKTIIK